MSKQLVTTTAYYLRSTDKAIHVGVDPLSKHGQHWLPLSQISLLEKSGEPKDDWLDDYLYEVTFELPQWLADNNHLNYIED